MSLLCECTDPPIHRRALLAAALGAGLLASGCASLRPPLRPPASVTPVTPFDLQRYQGLWYELARLDHGFERGMTDVTAEYTPQPDGSVKVVNRGFSVPRGQWQRAVGKALFTGDPGTASLKVSFFGPFYGGYHVAALDPDYRWALVVGPDTGYCWILARDPSLPPQTLQSIVARAGELGVDTSALIWVSHARRHEFHGTEAP